MKRKDNKALIQKIYGADDLGEKPIFQGGYINFGYWKDIEATDRPITHAERIEASVALYDLVFDYLNVKPDDEILEIGCGRGYGCSRLIEKFTPKCVVGIDITPKQVERARELQAAYCQKPYNLTFEVAAADSMPFPDNTFDKIYAVESAQHIPSIPKFSKEAWRLLKPDGLLIVTAHFSTSLAGYKTNCQNFPLIEQGIDLLLPFEVVLEGFTKQGFKVVDIQNIGAEVFWGIDKWSSQVVDALWAINYLKMYKEGNLDYYLFILKKG